MAQGLFVRFVFIFNFLNFNYFPFLGMLGLENHHSWWKEYFSRTPGSYRYTNSIELVPRFGLWPSPRSSCEYTFYQRTCTVRPLSSLCIWESSKFHQKNHSFACSAFKKKICPLCTAGVKLHQHKSREWYMCTFQAVSLGVQLLLVY
jgi:ribosomal protein S27AE